VDAYSFNNKERVEWDKLQELLNINDKIDTSKNPCKHPLAILNIKTKNDKKLTYVSRRNFVSYDKYEVVDQQVSPWLETGVIADAPADSPYSLWIKKTIKARKPVTGSVWT
jgi:hypothetical protein